jgi:hypothetical protein
MNLANDCLEQPKELTTTNNKKKWKKPSIEVIQYYQTSNMNKNGKIPDGTKFS